MSSSEEAILSAVTARAAHCKGSSNLSAALADPPVLSKVPETKQANADVVSGVLQNIGEGDIQKQIDGLSTDECDTLMKYLYKLMGDSGNTDRNGVLLKWHSKLVEKTGPGSIVRSMTDRKTV